MLKLTLDLDSLQVDSFDTAPGARASRGTVAGHAVTRYEYDQDVPIAGSDALQSCEGGGESDKTCQISICLTCFTCASLVEVCCA